MPKVRSYEASDIVHLEGLEPIIQNVGMYLGDSGPKGLHHMILEVISNSIDEATNGYGNVINVTIGKDGSLSVEDFGRGMPVAMHPKYHKPALEILMCMMNSGGKMVKDASYKVSAGLHGLGTKIVNALSDFTEVTVYRDGKEYFQRFEKGLKVTELLVKGKSSRTGTILKFKPRKDIFKETTEWNYSTIKAMVKRMCYLNSHITINLTDERSKKKESFHYPNGVVGMVMDSIGSETSKIMSNPIRIVGTTPTIMRDGRESEYEVEVVFTYVDSSSENIVSFANAAPTIDGGTHVQGFRSALTRTINEAARNLDKLKAKDENLKGSEITEGIVAVVNAKVPDPIYESQTKVKLTNPEVAGQTMSIITEKLKHWFEDNPKETSKILDKILQTRKIRDSIRKYKDALLNKNNKVQQLLDTTGKLSPCSGRDTLVNEIILVEGKHLINRPR